MDGALMARLRREEAQFWAEARAERATMTDHVAVLREMRAVMLDSGGMAALDHAIAAVAERDALVARLGEARDLLNEAKFDLAELREQQILPRKRAPYDRQIEQIEAWLAADDLARVVKESSNAS